MDRTERFLDELDTLVNDGEGFESEIESEVRLRHPEQIVHFLHKASEASSILSCIAGNLLTDVEVKVRRGARARAGA